MTRTRWLAATIAGLTLAAAAPAAAEHGTRSTRGHWGEEQAMRVQLGLFTPRGESQYWSDKTLDFTGDANDFENAVAGVEYLRFLGNRLGLAASGTFYSGDNTTHYLDFVDPRGFEILHDTTLDLSALNLGLLLHLASRSATISPYVGAGGGLFVWTISEIGEFIDFGVPGGEIFFGDFETDGATLGYYLQAGVEVPVATNWSIYADAKWLRAKDDLDGDFEGLGELDLSGRAISFGASVSF